MQLLLLCWLLWMSVWQSYLQKSENSAHSVAFSSTSVASDSCTTASDKSGNCIAIYQCRNLIEQRNVGLLRRSLCGFEGKDPKVCCPLAEEEDSTFGPVIYPKGFNSNDTEVNYTTVANLFVNSKKNGSKTLSSDKNSTNSNHFNTTNSWRRKHAFFPSDCGKSQVTFRRIVGGQESAVGSWPWMVVIYYVRRNRLTAECGGVLITEKHVLTAAHCIVTSRRGATMRPWQIRVRLGDHDIERTDDGANPVDIAIESIIKINNFDLRTFQNDIAILLLKTSVTFSEFIAPICLPFNVFQGDDLSQRNAFVAGWGTLSYGGPASSKLQEVQVRVWENERCKNVFRREVPITIANLCAGDGDKDACRGDSGGPLMLSNEDGRFYLVGIVSFGKKCAEPGIPGVYTRISNFLDWIESNIENTM